MNQIRSGEAERTGSLIGAFYEVYNELGFGYPEQFYAAALEYELVLRGHRVVREFSVQVSYKGKALGTLRLDVVVDDQVVVENKSSETLHPSAARQLFSY